MPAKRAKALGLDDPGPLPERVQRAIHAALPGRGAGFSLVARRLGTSETTLYRHLRLHGVSFSDLARDVRCALAVSQLDQPDVPVTEIALLLGYSELSAFSRAFRGWTGLSPAAFRRQRSTCATCTGSSRGSPHHGEPRRLTQP